MPEPTEIKKRKETEKMLIIDFREEIVKKYLEEQNNVPNSEYIGPRIRKNKQWQLLFPIKDEKGKDNYDKNNELKYPDDFKIDAKRLLTLTEPTDEIQENNKGPRSENPNSLKGKDYLGEVGKMKIKNKEWHHEERDWLDNPDNKGKDIPTFTQNGGKSKTRRVKKSKKSRKSKRKSKRRTRKH